MTQTNQNPGTTTVSLFNPPQLHDTRLHGYSTAAITPLSGRLAFISGQGAHDGAGALSPDFAGQVVQAYANLDAVLAALGARRDQVVKLTVFVVDHDMAKLGPLTVAVTAMFADKLPAQTLVPVPRLAVDGMLFEVEAVAILEG